MRDPRLAVATLDVPRANGAIESYRRLGGSD
jgi:hypothetical protein